MKDDPQPMKIIGIDTETTGLDPQKNTIVQLAGYVEIDYQVVERFNFLCNPLDKEVTAEALKLTKKTEEELMARPHPMKARKSFIEILDKYVDRYDKFDKFMVAGFNVKFDLDMLGTWLKEGGEEYFFSFVGPCTLDPMSLTATLQYLGAEDYSGLANRRLGTLCKHHGIPLDDKAHDAEHDIEATRLLIKKQLEILEGIK